MLMHLLILRVKVNSVDQYFVVQVALSIFMQTSRIVNKRGPMKRHICTILSRYSYGLDCVREHAESMFLVLLLLSILFIKVGECLVDDWHHLG